MWDYQTSLFLIDETYLNQVENSVNEVNNEIILDIKDLNIFELKIEYRKEDTLNYVQNYYINSNLVQSSNFKLDKGIKFLNFYSFYYQDNNFNIYNYSIKDLTIDDKDSSNIFNFNASDWPENTTIDNIPNFSEWSEGTAKNVKIQKEEDITILEIPNYFQNEILEARIPLSNINIPVIFHIIKEKSGLGDNFEIDTISLSSTQLSFLNKSFNKLNTAFEETNASRIPPNTVYQNINLSTEGNTPMKIRFVPGLGDNKIYQTVAIDPNGKYKSWLNPNYDDILSYESNSAATQIGKNFNNTCNIYISAGANEEEGPVTLGFADFIQTVGGTPEHGIWVREDCVLDNYFGNDTDPRNQSTLVHEMGHYLGLFHTFTGSFEEEGPCNLFTGNALDVKPQSRPDGGLFWENNDKLGLDDIRIPNTCSEFEGRDDVYNYMSYSTTIQFTDYQLYAMWDNIYQYMKVWWPTDNNQSNTYQSNTYQSKIITKPETNDLISKSKLKDKMIFEK